MKVLKKHSKLIFILSVFIVFTIFFSCGLAKKNNNSIKTRETEEISKNGFTLEKTDDNFMFFKKFSKKVDSKANDNTFTYKNNVYTYVDNQLCINNKKVSEKNLIQALENSMNCEINEEADKIVVKQPFNSQSLIISENINIPNAKKTKISNNCYEYHFLSEEATRNNYLKLKNKGVNVEINDVFQVSSTDEQKLSDLALYIQRTDHSTYLASGSTAKTVTIAILDTGIDTNAKCFKDKYIDKGYNFSNSGEIDSIYDDNGHGSKMALMMIQNITSNVKLLPIKVSNADGLASLSSLCQGIRTAIDNNVNVINISMSCYMKEKSEVLESLINEAYDKNIAVVVSAGNNSSDIKNYAPANIEKAITVSAINNDCSVADYSNYGEYIDYCSISKIGTSYSSAFASAIIASIKSISNSDDYETILNKYVIDLGNKGKDIYYGNGLISIKNINLNNINTDNKINKKNNDIFDETTTFELNASQDISFEYFVSDNWTSNYNGWCKYDIKTVDNPQTLNGYQCKNIITYDGNNYKTTVNYADATTFTLTSAEYTMYLEYPKYCEKSWKIVGNSAVSGDTESLANLTYESDTEYDIYDLLNDYGNYDDIVEGGETIFYLYLQEKEIEYNLTYEYDEDTIIDDGIHKYSDNIPLPTIEPPVKDASGKVISGIQKKIVFSLEDQCNEQAGTFGSRTHCRGLNEEDCTIEYYPDYIGWNVNWQGVFDEGTTVNGDDFYPYDGDDIIAQPAYSKTLIIDGSRLPIPSKAGYQFNNWVYYEPSSTGSFTSGMRSIINADTELAVNLDNNKFQSRIYSDWTYTDGCTINYYYENSLVYSEDVKSGTSIALHEIELYGSQTFCGWSKYKNSNYINYNNKEVVTDISPAGTIINLYAIVEYGEYQVAFHKNSGTTDKSKEYSILTTDDSSIYISNDNETSKIGCYGHFLDNASTKATQNSFKFTDDSNEDFLYMSLSNGLETKELLGWATEPDGDIVYDAIDFSISNLTQNETLNLYAVWEDFDGFAIKYHTNYGNSNDKIVTRYYDKNITSLDTNELYNYVYDDDILFNELNRLNYINENNEVDDTYEFLDFSQTQQNYLEHDSLKNAQLSLYIIEQTQPNAVYDLYLMWSLPYYLINYTNEDNSEIINMQASEIDTEVTILDYNETLSGNKIFNGWTETENDNTVNYLANQKYTNLADIHEIIYLYPVITTGIKIKFHTNYNNSYDKIYTQYYSSDKTSLKKTDLPSDFIADTSFINENGDIDISKSIYDYSTTKYIGLVNTAEYICNTDTIISTLDENETYDVYVVWAEASYKIKFHANYNNAIPENYTKTFLVNKNIALDFNTFKRNGYVFKGWATEPNGDIEYLDGEIVRNIDNGTKQVDLYAKWEIYNPDVISEENVILETYNQDDIDSKSCLVDCNKASVVIVTIPKKIVLNGSVDNTSSVYALNVKGDIGSSQTVSVIPKKTITIYDKTNTKESIIGTVVQNNTQWAWDELDVKENNVLKGTTKLGTINTPNMTAGSWGGKFAFKIIISN